LVFRRKMGVFDENDGLFALPQPCLGEKTGFPGQPQPCPGEKSGFLAQPRSCPGKTTVESARHGRVQVKKANFLAGNGGGRTIPPSRRTETGVEVCLVGRMNERLVQAVSFGSVFSLACPQARCFPSVGIHQAFIDQLFSPFYEAEEGQLFNSTARRDEGRWGCPNPRPCGWSARFCRTGPWK